MVSNGFDNVLHFSTIIEAFALSTTWSANSRAQDLMEMIFNNFSSNLPQAFFFSASAPTAPPAL